MKYVGVSPFLYGRNRGPVPEHTLREPRAVSRVEHPAVADVYDVVEEDGRPTAATPPWPP